MSEYITAVHIFARIDIAADFAAFNTSAGSNIAADIRTADISARIDIAADTAAFNASAH